MLWRCNMSIEYGDKLKVNWVDEGLDGDNNGYIYGIYYYDKKFGEDNPDKQEDEILSKCYGDVI